MARRYSGACTHLILFDVCMATTYFTLFSFAIVYNGEKGQTPAGVVPHIHENRKGL